MKYAPIATPNPLYATKSHLKEVDTIIPSESMSPVEYVRYDVSLLPSSIEPANPASHDCIIEPMVNDNTMQVPQINIYKRLLFSIQAKVAAANMIYTELWIPAPTNAIPNIIGMLFVYVMARMNIEAPMPLRTPLTPYAQKVNMLITTSSGTKLYHYLW